MPGSWRRRRSSSTVKPVFAASSKDDCLPAKALSGRHLFNLQNGSAALYSQQQMSEIIKNYSNPTFHKMIGEIIKKHSQNKEDIRETARRQIDLNRVRRILDLGCGYGWFEENLKGEFDFIYGIDCLGANESGFLKAAGGIAKEAVFKRMHLPTPTDIPGECFDLIVSTYSLYFFPEAIPEVERLLCPEGVFLVITHSESMLNEVEDFFDSSYLKKVIGNFSAENGEKILKEHFSEVRSIDYPNRLIFKANDSEDLSSYIDFKRGFITSDSDTEIVKQRVLEELQKKGAMGFNKNDRIFIAKK
jgi:SAM-dependent methyltransferase